MCFQGLPGPPRLCSADRHSGFSLQRTDSGARTSLGAALGLWSTGSVVVAHGLNCPSACEIFLEQGADLCPLPWQAVLNRWTTREALSCLLRCVLHAVSPHVCSSGLAWPRWSLDVPVQDEAWTPCGLETSSPTCPGLASPPPGHSLDSPSLRPPHMQCTFPEVGNLLGQVLTSSLSLSHGLLSLSRDQGFHRELPPSLAGPPVSGSGILP